MGLCQAWAYSALVLLLGKGVSGVDAWYATSLDVKEVFIGAVDGHVHLFVADVIKSFDTVDRGILDCALGRLGLPDWFRKVYFSYRANVRLRFNLATGLGEATRDGGIPQGCPLSMVFIVALYVPWCRYLSSQQGVTPQLYADNLKCTIVDGHALLRPPDLLISMLGPWGRKLLLVSVSFSAPPKLLGGICEIRLFLQVTEVGVLNLMFVTWEVILILIGLVLVR